MGATAMLIPAQDSHASLHSRQHSRRVGLRFRSRYSGGSRHDRFDVARFRCAGSAVLDRSDRRPATGQPAASRIAGPGLAIKLLVHPLMAWTMVTLVGGFSASLGLCGRADGLFAAGSDLLRRRAAVSALCRAVSQRHPARHRRLGGDRYGNALSGDPRSGAGLCPVSQVTRRCEAPTTCHRWRQKLVMISFARRRVEVIVGGAGAILEHRLGPLDHENRVDDDIVCLGGRANSRHAIIDIDRMASSIPR